MKPLQILFIGQFVENRVHDVLKAGELPDADVAAGKPSACGLDDAHPGLPEQLQIALGHRVQVHAGVHRGRDQLPAGAGKKGGGQHVIRQPERELCHDVGGRRRDDEQVGLLRQRNMLDIPLKVPVKGVDDAFVAGQRFKGQRRYEFGGVFGHDAVHVGVQLDEVADKLRGFIGGDAAGDADQDGFGSQHRIAPF